MQKLVFWVIEVFLAAYPILVNIAREIDPQNNVNFSIAQRNIIGGPDGLLFVFILLVVTLAHVTERPSFSIKKWYYVVALMILGIVLAGTPLMIIANDKKTPSELQWWYDFQVSAAIIVVGFCTVIRLIPEPKIP